MSRPETGSMEFDGDWCGIFIRGDNALSLIQTLDRAIEGQSLHHLDIISINWLKELINTATHQVDDPNRQKMRSFDECKKDKNDNVKE